MIKKTVACSYSIYVHIIVFCRKNEVFGKLSYLFKKEGVFLATIIEQIIAIDSDAQKRLDEAASYKDVCEREIEQTTRALTEQKRKVIDETLEKTQQEESKKAQQTQHEILRRHDEAVSDLVKRYESQKDAVIEDLFQRVIQ